VRNLRESFNQDHTNGAVVVKIVPPEEVLGIAAQIKEDQLNFPIVALTRTNPQIDTTRTNFTAMNRGVFAVMDAEKNEIYNERAVPITLSYTLTILTTNTADRDELVRELIFKYTNEFFLSITLPYEVERVMRFGIVIDRESDIDYSSGSPEYLQSGQLYQAMIQLNIHGAVLVHNVPFKLKRVEHELRVGDPTPKVATYMPGEPRSQPHPRPKFSST